MVEPVIDHDLYDNVVPYDFEKYPKMLYRGDSTTCVVADTAAEAAALEAGWTLTLGREPARTPAIVPTPEPHLKGEPVSVPDVPTPPVADPVTRSSRRGRRRG